MPILAPDLRLPRLWGSTPASLIKLHGEPADQISTRPFELRTAQFFPHGERVESSALEAWRDSLNHWAEEHGFGAKTTRKSEWDVDLGVRLIEDLDGHPEADRPDVWCWMASNLLTHFVVFRFGWPSSSSHPSDDADDDHHDAGGRTGSWERFGATDKNALFLARYRVLTYGESLARRATQQEFQSLQYRPGFGLDQRVARVIVATLVEAFEEPSSNYGKHGGNRALDCNDVCIELQKINSLQPLCFYSDESIAEVVTGVIARLPQLRRPSKSRGKGKRGDPA